MTFDVTKVPKFEQLNPIQQLKFLADNMVQDLYVRVRRTRPTKPCGSTTLQMPPYVARGYDVGVKQAATVSAKKPPRGEWQHWRDNATETRQEVRNHFTKQNTIVTGLQ